jgi:hypothetical protein
MGLNSVSPTEFPSGVLIADSTKNAAGGSSDAITAKITPGAAVDVQSALGGFIPPRMTTTQRLDLPLNNGMIVYDITTNQLFYVENGSWTPLVGGGDPNATYIVQVPDASLPNSQALSSLTSGVLQSTTGTGVVSIATIIVDDPLHSNLTIGKTAANTFFTGTNNVYIGEGIAGHVTTAENNIVIGGSLAFQEATSASNCIAIGAASLQAITTGINDTACGVSSLTNIGSGQGCSAFGTGAASNVAGSDFVCAFGLNALGNAVGASNTTVLGANAGNTQSHYTNCIFIGEGSDASSDGLTNAVAIGNGALVGQSNSCVFGTGNMMIGVGTTTPGAFIDVHAGAGKGISTVSTGMAFSANGGISYKTVSTPTNYSALADDFFIIVSDTTSARTITLPAITESNTFQVYYVKDGDGGSATHNITVMGTGANVDGGTSLIGIAYGSLGVINDGTQWWTFARG